MSDAKLSESLIDAEMMACKHDSNEMNNLISYSHATECLAACCNICNNFGRRVSAPEHEEPTLGNAVAPHLLSDAADRTMYPDFPHAGAPLRLLESLLVHLVDVLAQGFDKNLVRLAMYQD